LNGTIDGRVIDARSGRAIAGVAVSNGREVVRTDAGGRFALPDFERLEFVFVTVPGAYRALTGAWFRPAAAIRREEELVFALEPRAGAPPGSFAFLQITDVHVAEGEDPLRARLQGRLSPQAHPDTLGEMGRTTAAEVRADLDEICRRHRGMIAFCAATGDLSEIGSHAHLGAYLRAIAGLPFPVANVPGNHDYLSGRDWAGGRYQFEVPPRYWEAAGGRLPWLELMGPAYYAFEWGELHFVVFDGEGHRQFGGAYPQMAWLEAHLAALPPGRPVVFLTHFQEDAAFYRPLAERGVVLSLSGHEHSSRVYHDGAIAHYNTPSFSFGGSDRSPRGYRLFHYRDGDFRVETFAFGPAPKAGFGPPAEAAAPREAAAPLGAPRAGWPQLGGDGGHRHARPEAVVRGLARAWSASLEGFPAASPVVEGALVAMATRDEDLDEGGGAIAVFDLATGGARWRRRLPTAIKDAPVLAGSRLVSLTVTGGLDCWDAASGERLWLRQLGDPAERRCTAAPALAGGVLYAGDRHLLAAVSLASGDLLWERDDLTDAHGMMTGPAVAGDAVYMGFKLGRPAFVALDRHSGAARWAKEWMAFEPSTSPVAVADDLLIVNRANGLIEALDRTTGESRWQTGLDAGWGAAAPAVIGDRVYQISGAGTLYALDLASGRVCWSVKAATPLSPRGVYRRSADGHTLGLAAAANGVLVADESFGLRFFDSDGRETFALAGPAASAPALTDSAAFYAGGGELVAVRIADPRGG
jgi:outer membrane protein assembly factor BamB